MERSELEKDVDAAYVGLKKTAQAGVGLGFDFLFNGFGNVLLFILSFITSWSILWILFMSENPVIGHFPYAAILLPFMVFGIFGIALHRRDVQKRKQDAINYRIYNPEE